MKQRAGLRWARIETYTAWRERPWCRALSAMLAGALALSLVPAGALQALAEELEPTAGEQPVEQITDEQVPMASPEAGEQQEEEPAPEPDPEPAPEAEPAPAPAPAPAQTMGVRRLLGAPAQPAAVAVSYGAETPQDGIYQSRMVVLTVTPQGEGVTLVDDGSRPTITLVCTDDNHDDHDIVYGEVSSWTVSPDGSQATCAVAAITSGTYYAGTITGIKTSASADTTSLGFALDGFEVAAAPAVSKIWLMDAQGNWITEEGSTEYFNVARAVAGATPEAPVVKDASTIVVRVKGALDTADSISHDTKTESNSYVVLLGEGGKELAVSNLVPVGNGTYEATFTRQLDNSRPLTDLEPNLPIPEGPLGFQIVALDKFGTQLTTTIDGTTYAYGLVAADFKNAGGTMVPKANGTFIHDKAAPRLTVTYPHDQAVTTYDGTMAESVVVERPADAAKTDFFNKAITTQVEIVDTNLDVLGTTVNGLTLQQLATAGTMEVNGATYKTTAAMDGTGYFIEITYAEGVYAPPLVVAKDVAHTVAYDAASIYDISGLVVDATAPTVTAAVVNAAPTGEKNDGANNVYFFRNGGNTALTLHVSEPYGIRSVEMHTAGSGYGLAELASVLEGGNDGLTTTAHTGAYELKVIDALAEERPLPDDVAFTITDFAGNQYLWSMRAKGLQKVGGVVSEANNADTLYDALGGTALLHPTLLLEDNVKPVVELTGATAGSFLSGATTISLKVTEVNLKYLRNCLAGGTESDPYINGTFAGVDPNRPVLTSVYTAAVEGGGTATSTTTVSALTQSDTDPRVYTLERQLTSDGDYEFTAKMIDAAGNESNEAVIGKFTIDATPPTIAVSFDNNEAANTSYYKAPRTATVTVVEHNFDPSLFDVEVGVADAASGIVAPTPSAWQKKPGVGDTYECTIAFTNDGTYWFDVLGTDKADNAAVRADDPSVIGYDQDGFTVDTEAPLIARYVAAGESWSPTDMVLPMPQPTSPNNLSYMGVSYYDKPITLDAQVRDRNFSAADTTVDGATASWTMPERDADAYRLHQLQTPISYTADGEYLTPEIATTDLAGNSANNAGERKQFVVDLNPPEVAVSIDRSPTSQGHNGSSDPYNFYNQTTTLTFTVSDAHLLRSVELADPDGTYTPTFAAEGKKQVTGTVTLQDGSSTSSNTEYERNIVLIATDMAGHRRTWSIDRKGTVSLLSDGSASEVENPSINGAGDYPYVLIQDTVAPAVGLAGVTAGTYYNTPQSVTATVNEFNMGYLQMFDGSRTIVTVTKYEPNAGRAQSSWTVPASSFGGTRPNYSFAQPFDTDGHYVVRAQFADFANNLSNEATIGEFTIDTTPPQLSMEFDNNDVRNGMYYKATRTATITVLEHNFDASLFIIQTEGAIGGWTDNGDTHTCQVFFGEGGPYTITVGGRDLAGNEAAEVSEPEFIVDLTAPTITLAGTAQRLGYVGEGAELQNAYHGTLEDKSAYNGVVVPLITYSDNEVLSSADLAHTLSGSKHGQDIEHESATSAEDKVMTVALRDVGYVGEGAGDGSNWEEFYVDDYAVDADDIYTLKATMTDQAGNEAEAEMTFSVNRYGSNYEVKMDGVDADELAEYQSSGMLSAAPTIVVREVNVSGVATEADHRVEKEFANATTAIGHAEGAGAGYGLSTTSGEDQANGWSEYVYTVRSANFGEGSDSDNNDRGQGVYRVNVMSDDTSSNANTTAEFWRSDERRAEAQTAGATAEFILDELGPAIDELNLPESITRGNSYEASFHVTDDITSGNTVEVLVDGKALPASEVSGPANGVGTFTFTIPARAFNWGRSVQIVVRDYAGRESSERNGSWFWLSSFVPEAGLVAGVVAAAVVAAVLARRRKLAAEPELPEF
ncbi:MAG: hypothetical protein IJI12_08620 [Atopobiaceae bacterium]|nr:hypothetical protein [Atopobiaceae bacterium]